MVASGGSATPTAPVGTSSGPLQWFVERALEPGHGALKSNCKTYQLCALATKPLGASALHLCIETDDSTEERQPVGVLGKT